MKREQRGWIPGVPAFHTGGTATFLHQLTEHGVTSPGFGGGPAPPPPGPESPRDRLLREGFVELVPGEFFNFTTGESINLNRPSPSPGGGGTATPQFRPGELEFLREQFNFEQEQAGLDLELRRLQEQHNFAIATQDLALRRQTEARIAEIQRRQQQLDAALGRAQGIAGLASSRGNIEAQRSQFLSQLAANPRDFAQLNIGLGGGQSFLGNLLGNRPVGGQSTSLIGNTPTLGADFQRLLQAVTARPDVPLFEEALEGFRNVPEFRKGGTHMVTDEPILGIGLLSGMPKFTLGEPAPGFPLGKSEDVDFSADGRRMKVTPMAHGGQVTAPGQGLTGLFGDMTFEDIMAGIAKPPQAPAPSPTSPAKPGQGPTPFTFPDFPGIGTLLDFLFQGSSLQQAQQNFGTGGIGAQQLGQGVLDFQQSIPRTPGEAIRSLMSGLGPRQFHGLLPSQLGLLESVVSAIGVPPQDFFSSLTRSFPTGPDPSRISFGNFLEGGTVTVMPQEPGSFYSYLSAA